MKTFSIILFLIFLSNPVLGQKNIPKYYSSSDDIWLNALSKTANQNEIKNITNLLGTSGALSDLDEFHEALSTIDLMVWPNKSLKLGFSKLPPKMLSNIYFYNKSSDRAKAKNLPFNLSFEDSIEKIKIKYGTNLTEDSKGNFLVHVYPEKYPFVFMIINMDKGKVGHAITLYYDEFAAYQANPSPHNLGKYADMCEVFSAIIEDVDNKFFSFRGDKTNDILDSWKSNIIIDPDEVSETKIFGEYVLLNGYEGTDHDEAAFAFESLYYYFDLCIEEGSVPYTWKKVEEESEEFFKTTLTTTEKNIKIEHHFKVEKQRFTADKSLKYSAYTLFKFFEG